MIKRYFYKLRPTLVSILRQHQFSRNVQLRNLPIAFQTSNFSPYAGFKTGQILFNQSETMGPRLDQSESALTEQHYRQFSDLALEYLLDRFEEFGEELDTEGFDVEYSNGVLTLRLGVHGTYVINKQPPSKQIWLSSPFSGPKRFDYVSSINKWVYRRENMSLDSLLQQELSKVLNKRFDINIPNA